LAQGPYSETIKIITQPESELGQAYATLKSLFDQTKKIYSQQKPFLSADELSISEPAHRATIRTTNLATFVSSVFGGQDVGFYELNDHFIQTFVPDGEGLPRESGMLYLNLKTQMYLSAISQEEQEQTKEEILDDLFPPDMEERLLARHPGTTLTSDEMEFLKEAKDRRDYLQSEAGDVDSICKKLLFLFCFMILTVLAALSEKYAWEDFLKSLSGHLKKAYEPLIAPYMRRHALTAPPVTAQNTAGTNPETGQPSDHIQDAELDDIDLIEQATQAATQAALQSVGYGTYNGQPQNGGE
jgi:protein TBF1